MQEMSTDNIRNRFGIEDKNTNLQPDKTKAGKGAANRFTNLR